MNIIFQKEIKQFCPLFRYMGIKTNCRNRKIEDYMTITGSILYKDLPLQWK